MPHIRFVCLVALTAAAAAAAAACSDPEPEPEPEPDPRIEINRKLDILFVVDDSGSMQEEQANLQAGFINFTNGLRDIPGGMPDLHVGVVSANTGALDGIVGCEGAGDGGRLLRQANCSQTSDSFLRQGYDGNGVTQNFTGTLEETFSCMASLGVSGCGFESPLESLKLALDGSNEENDNFLRDDAMLLVVIVSDEDDCSVSERASFYAEPNAAADSLLGAFGSFRCFDFGVTCNETLRDFGTKTGCGPQNDSPFLTPPTEFATFLKDLKGPGRTAIALITGLGEPSPDGSGFNATVRPNPSQGQLGGTPQLGPVCSSSAGEAVPAIRLEAFRDEFPTSTVDSICNATFDFPRIADSLAGPLSSACLDPAQPLPTSCAASVIDTNGTATPASECLGSSDTGCYAIASSTPACDGGPSISYRYPDDSPLGVRFSADCN